ncbi:hypothetical protein EVAR_72161_1 [Eumeta japonica]|uniref:Uncharacterized protein n=1 Tax=Eumeta variegata TaxID=151549 RepID=A0A4C1TMJ8_EUMVA|nr:hypothetical protein EVAR_72161_1 [Eumeta japonica]
MALIPIVFKFGILSAMVTFLVGLGIKTLLLVKVLVVMNLLALLAKFLLSKQFGHVEHFAAPPAPMWSPYITAPEGHHTNKEIHLHIHGGHIQPQPSSYLHGSGVSGQTYGWENVMILTVLMIILHYRVNKMNW